MQHHRSSLIAVLGTLLLWATSAAAGPTDVQQCQADKLKRTGKYAFCRMKADSKAVKTGQPADYTKCDQQITDKFGSAEATYGVECPTTGDVADIQSQATADTDFLALKLTGVRFVDNGDGTVTDTYTGLQWEKKDSAGGGMNLANPHDVDNLYSWSSGSTSTAADGSAFTHFLSQLNTCTSVDGATVAEAFAGYCDWRLPTITELQSVLLAAYPCGASPCLDPVFGPTGAFGNLLDYWSSTTFGGDPPFGDPAAFAWVASFQDGQLSPTCKDPLSCDFLFGGFPARAVRSGP